MPPYKYVLTKNKSKNQTQKEVPSGGHQAIAGFFSFDTVEFSHEDLMATEESLAILQDD